MARHLVRLPREDRGLLEIVSHARTPTLRRDRLSPDQIAQVARTVRRTPEVMVKVTGGGTSIRAVSAHLAYITRHSDLELHSDDGTVASDRETQRVLTKHWHLDLSSRQGGSRRGSDKPGRAYKLVQNIVLSMPHPTPPEKVLAAAKVFAREKFGLQHRYAMALHTDQRHPHVHLVVKAEDYDGRRLHIDKPMLRSWREDFARMMRAQGVAANATPRALRGRNKGHMPTEILRARRRKASTSALRRLNDIVKELRQTGRISDPAHARLVETRKALLAQWEQLARTLDAQGEIALAGDVRHYAQYLPPVLTDRQRIASAFLAIIKEERDKEPRDRRPERVQDRGEEALTR
jgi:DNA-binding transcriptional regulator YiaG